MPSLFDADHRVAGAAVVGLIGSDTDDPALSADARWGLATTAAILGPDMALHLVIDSGDDRDDPWRDRLELTVAVSGPDGADLAPTARAIGGLLAGNHAVAEITVPDEASLRHRLNALAEHDRAYLVPVVSEFRDGVVGFAPGESASVEHLPALPRHMDLGLSRLCEALLRVHGRTLMHVRLRPAAVDAATRRSLASRHVADGRADNVRLAQVMGEIGEPLRVSVQLRGDVADSGVLVAAMRAFSGMVPWRDGPTEITMGAAVASQLVPLPRPRDGLAPGFAVRLGRVMASPWPVIDRPALRVGEASAATGQVFRPTVSDADLTRHLHVMGATGVGKSTLLADLIRQDAANGSVWVLDPHGSLVDDLLTTLGPDAERAVVLDAADLEHPIPFNPLRVSDELARATAVQDIGEMFHDLFDPNHQGIVGPRFENYLRMAVRALMAETEGRASFLEVPRMMSDAPFRNRILEHVADPLVRSFWTTEFSASQRSSDAGEVAAWVNSKFDAFRGNVILRNLLGSGEDRLDLAGLRRRRAIVLISLAKGAVGAVNARLLGYLYLTRLWGAVLRDGVAAADMPISLYVDEAQSFSLGSLPAMVAEGRKFGLRVVMAHQFSEQLSPEMRSAMTGTVAGGIYFRCGADDARAAAAHVAPTFSAADLTRLPSFEAAAALLADNEPQPAFTLRVPAPPGPEGRDVEAAERIRAASRRDLGVSRATVERWLAERWEARPDDTTFVEKWRTARSAARSGD